MQEGRDDPPSPSWCWEQVSWSIVKHLGPLRDSTTKHNMEPKRKTNSIMQEWKMILFPSVPEASLLICNHALGTSKGTRQPNTTWKLKKNTNLVMQDGGDESPPLDAETAWVGYLGKEIWSQTFVVEFGSGFTTLSFLVGVALSHLDRKFWSMRTSCRTWYTDVLKICNVIAQFNFKIC